MSSPMACCGSLNTVRESHPSRLLLVMIEHATKTVFRSMHPSVESAHEKRSKMLGDGYAGCAIARTPTGCVKRDAGTETASRTYVKMWFLDAICESVSKEPNLCVAVPFPFVLMKADVLGLEEIVSLLP